MSPNLTKADLVSFMAKDIDLSKAKTEKILGLIIENIQLSLSEGKSIQLVGFGSFSTKKRASRKVRNPNSGELMKIPEKTVPIFRPGKQLREMVGPLNATNEDTVAPLADNQKVHREKKRLFQRIKEKLVGT